MTSFATVTKGLPKNVSRIKWIDPEVVRLCNAMNKVNGIRTCESCCGHGKHPFMIWFYAQRMSSLAKIAHAFLYFSERPRSWEIVTDVPSGSGVNVFFVQSRATGDRAYRQANSIAEAIENWIETGNPNLPPKNNLK